MLTDMLAGATVYIVTGYTDMRKGIDGLSIIVEGKLGQDVYSKSVYLFFVQASRQRQIPLAENGSRGEEAVSTAGSMADGRS